MSTTTLAPGTEGFKHPALFYRDATDYLTGTVPFVRGALESGEPVAVAVPGPNLTLIKAELGSDAQHVHLVDMNEAGRNPGRIIPGVLRAFADAHLDQPVRIVGEPIWPGRTEDEYPACVQHEALINNAFEGRDATIMCPYDALRLSPTVLADAEATHPVLIDHSGARESHDYAPAHIVQTYNRPFGEPDGAFSVTVDGARLSSFRQQAGRFAEEFGLSGTHIADVQTVLTELVTNSVMHGGGEGSVRLWTNDGHLVCEVQDEGVLTDPLAGRHPADPGQIGGRGLLLVNHIADLVQVRTSTTGTVTRVHFRRR